MVKHLTLVLVTVAFTLFSQSAGAEEKAWEIERVKNGKGNIIALKIFKKGQKLLHQQLRGFEASPPEYAVEGGFDVELKDINFDGNKDILVFEFRPPGPNIPYLYWLYDPVSDKFECRDPDPNDPNKNCIIVSPEFDYEKKRVVQNYRSAAHIHGTTYFVWQDGKLVMIKNVEEEADVSGRTKVTVMERKDGKRVSKKQYIK